MSTVIPYILRILGVCSFYGFLCVSELHMQFQGRFNHSRGDQCRSILTCLNCDSGRNISGLEFGMGGYRGKNLCIYQIPCLCVFFFAESSPALCFLAQGFSCLETLARSVKITILKSCFRPLCVNYSLIAIYKDVSAVSIKNKTKTSSQPENS